MNVQAFQNIQSSCELALAETKTVEEKHLLSSANNNLKYCLHIYRQEKSFEKTDNNKKKNSNFLSDQDLPESLKKYVLSAEEVALIGQACKLSLLAELKCSPSNRNTRTIKSLLDLVTALISSGVIPTDFTAGVASVKTEEKGGTPLLLSKLLGSRQSREVSLVESTEEPKNVYFGLVESTITAGELLSTRAFPDRLYDAACLAVRACVAPPLSRQTVKSLTLISDQLNVQGVELCKMFELLLVFLKNPCVTSDIIENALNSVCKSVVLSFQEVCRTKNESLADGALSLESTVETMISMSSDVLDSFSKVKSASPDELSKQLLGTRCLLHFFAQIIECKEILLSGEKITSALKMKVLPSTLALLRTSDSNIYFQDLTVIQFFCYWRGAYKPLNCLRNIFLNVYFRTLQSPRIADAKKMCICQALPMHIQKPFDFIYLFLQRESLSTPSLLEQAIDYLCKLCVHSNDLVSALTKENANSSNGFLSDAKYARFVVDDFRKSIDERGSEAVRRSALGSLLEIVLSASRWINEKHHSSFSPSPNKEETLPVSNFYGMMKFERAYKRFLCASDLYQKFIHAFTSERKTEKAIEILEHIPNSKTFDESLCSEEIGDKQSPNPLEPENREIRSAKKVAKLLKESDGNLDKVILGEYFSKCLRDDNVHEIFKEWISFHDFIGLNIDEALRLFLGGFKLVGEAQVVDKTMELFAEHFFKQNPSSFLSFDAAFILAFSICMLNTDAHSPHIKNRMKLEEFLQNNRGIDGGNDVDSAVLQSVYERISQEEIVLRKDKETLNVTAIEYIMSSFLGSEDENLSASSTESHSKRNSEGALSQNKETLASNFTENEPLFRLEEFRDEFVASVSDEMISDTEAPILPHHLLWTNPKNFRLLWQTIADKVCYTAIDAIMYILQISETPASGSDNASVVDPAEAFYEKAENRLHFATLRNAVFHIVRICTFFRMTSHIDTLIESLFVLTSLSSIISFSGSKMVILSAPSPLRLELLVTMVNAFRVYGNCFSSYSWTIGYYAISVLDAVANGIEGWWRRRAAASAKEICSSANTTNLSTAEVSSVPFTTNSFDRWFGNVKDVPQSISSSSFSAREKILIRVRKATSCSVDAWLDHLFDATRFLPSTRISLLEGLISCCNIELQQGRNFSLNKLVEFLTICQSTFGYGETFFRLWNSSREVFKRAAEASPEIAVQALEDLLVIILHGCLREEGSEPGVKGKQKKLLQPLEDIFFRTKDEVTKLKVLSVIQDLMDHAAGVLRDGWPIVVSTLCGAGNSSILCCQEGWKLILRMVCLSNRAFCPWASCFSSFLDCLSTYGGSSFATESICLTSVSLLVACGRWITIGWHDLVEPLSKNEDIPGEIVRWGVTLSASEEKAAVCEIEALESSSPSSHSFYTSLVERLKLVKMILAYLRTSTQHRFPRVRAHAIASMWELFKMYGPRWFSTRSVPSMNSENTTHKAKEEEGSQSLYSLEECLDDFYFPMIRHTVADTPSENAGGQCLPSTISFDRLDYRLLVQLALKGMWVAVLSVHVEDCVWKVIHFCKEFLWNGVLTRQQVENELVAAVISSFFDLFPLGSVCVTAGLKAGDASAVTTTVTPGEQVGSKMRFLEEQKVRDERKSEGIKDETNGNLSQWSFFSNLQGENADIFPTPPMFLSWLTDFKRTSPIDLKEFARFSKWAELFHTGAASLEPIFFNASSSSFDSWVASSSPLLASSPNDVQGSSFLCVDHDIFMRLQKGIRECILVGFDGMRRRIADALQDCILHLEVERGNLSDEARVGEGETQQGRGQLEETWTVYLQQYRLILLGVGHYIVQTRHIQGLWLFYHALFFSWRSSTALSAPLSTTAAIATTTVTGCTNRSKDESPRAGENRKEPCSSEMKATSLQTKEESRNLEEQRPERQLKEENEEVYFKNGIRRDLPPSSFLFSPSSISDTTTIETPVYAELLHLIPMTIGVLQLTLLASSFFFVPSSSELILFASPISSEVEEVLVAISELFFNHLIQSRAFCLEDQRQLYRTSRKSDRSALTPSSFHRATNKVRNDGTSTTPRTGSGGKAGKVVRHGPPLTTTTTTPSASGGGEETSSPSSPSLISHTCSSSLSFPVPTTIPTSSALSCVATHRPTQHFTFTAVFRECCVPAGTEGEVFPLVQYLHNRLEQYGERRFHECRYLMGLLSVKLLFAMSSSASIRVFSYLLSCVPMEVQLDLVSELPGVLEETTATEFLRRYWSLLSLDWDYPTSFLLTEWMQMIKESHKVRTTSVVTDPFSRPLFKGETDEGELERTNAGFVEGREEVGGVAEDSNSFPAVVPLSPTNVAESRGTARHHPADHIYEEEGEASATATHTFTTTVLSEHPVGASGTSLVERVMEKREVEKRKNVTMHVMKEERINEKVERVTDEGDTELSGSLRQTFTVSNEEEPNPAALNLSFAHSSVCASRKGSVSVDARLWRSTQPCFSFSPYELLGEESVKEADTVEEENEKEVEKFVEENQKNLELNSAHSQKKFSSKQQIASMRRISSQYLEKLEVEVTESKEEWNGTDEVLFQEER